MSEIDQRTAELAYVSLKAAVRLAAPQRNGRALPADVQQALIELKAAAATARDNARAVDTGPVALPLFGHEQIDVPEAARRLGITPSAVRRRCAAGTLPAARVGQRAWLIEWRDHEHGNSQD